VKYDATLRATTLSPPRLLSPISLRSRIRTAIPLDFQRNCSESRFEQAEDKIGSSGASPRKGQVSENDNPAILGSVAVKIAFPTCSVGLGRITKNRNRFK